MPYASTYRSTRRSADATTPSVPRHSTPSATPDQRPVAGVARRTAGGHRDDEQGQRGDRDELGEAASRVLRVGQASGLQHVPVAAEQPTQLDQDEGHHQGVQRDRPAAATRGGGPVAPAARQARPGRRVAGQVRQAGRDGQGEDADRDLRRAAAAGCSWAGSSRRPRSARGEQQAEDQQQARVMARLRSEARTRSRRPPDRGAAPTCSHGTARTSCGAQLGPLSRMPRVERAAPATTAAVPSAASRHRATTQPASRTATTATSATDTATDREVQPRRPPYQRRRRRQPDERRPARRTRDPASTRPSAGRRPAPTAAQPPRTAVDAPGRRDAQNSRSARAGADGGRCGQVGHPVAGTGCGWSLMAVNVGAREPFALSAFAQVLWTFGSRM